MNLYGYAGGDPINNSDPFGLWPCCSIGIPHTSLYAGVQEAAEAERDEHRAFIVGLVMGGMTTTNAAGKSLGRLGRKVANIVGNHLNKRHLSAAARELRGWESGWDHVTEVREAAAGLRGTIAKLKGILGDPNLDAANRKQAEALLGRASRTLDAAEEALRNP